MVRGPTPISTYDTTTMLTDATSTASQPGLMSRRHTAVTSTVAASSQVSRSNSSRLMCRGRSATTVASIFAPGRPCRANSSTLATDSVPSAASAQPNAPAANTPSRARTSRKAVFATGLLLAGVLGRRRSGVVDRHRFRVPVEADRAEQPLIGVALRGPAGGVHPSGAEVGEDALLQREHLAFL